MNIAIENVRKQYGTVTALDGLSLTIPSGSTFGLLGTNGAGKTTLFRLLVGHDRPDAGTITVGGMDVASSGVRVREHVGYLPDSIGFPGSLTGWETLEFYANIHEVPQTERHARIHEALDLVGLSDAGDRRVKGYSNGMGRRLGLAAVLIGQPSVLVLDEPTAGLDPLGVAAFHRIVHRVSDETQATIVFASHALDEVERLCDDVAVIHEGQLLAAGCVDHIVEGEAGETTLSLHIPDAADRDATVQQLSAAEYISTRGATVDVTCANDSILDVLASIDPEAVEHLNIERASLTTAFRNTVEEGHA